MTLDWGRTVFGQRILADVTIENIGVGSVFWGHSGTCAFPVGIIIRPDNPVRMAYGRESWPGDWEILKQVTVDQRLSAADPAYAFSPPEWLDFEGNMACTSDLVISELAAGQSLVQQAGWDTLGYYGMPPAPGMYTVEATFAYMSRGVRPTGSEDLDAFSATLRIPVTIEGPDIDYLSPGEGVDALFSDAGFQALLRHAPRDLWVESALDFHEERWEMILYLSASDRDTQPVDAIVGVVDARSGHVVDTLREPRVRPGG